MVLPDRLLPAIFVERRAFLCFMSAQLDLFNGVPELYPNKRTSKRLGQPAWPAAGEAGANRLPLPLSVGAGRCKPRRDSSTNRGGMKCSYNRNRIWKILLQTGEFSKFRGLTFEKDDLDYMVKARRTVRRRAFLRQPGVASTQRCFSAGSGTNELNHPEKPCVHLACSLFILDKGNSVARPGRKAKGRWPFHR